MNNAAIMDALAKLRKCADELVAIVQSLDKAAHIEISPCEVAEIEKRHGVLVRRLVEELVNSGVAAKIIDVCEGPTVTRIRIELPPGVKYSKMEELRDHIQFALQTESLRIEAPIPGERYVGVEIQKETLENVTFADMVLPVVADAKMNRGKMALPVVVGKGVDGKTIVEDLAMTPHLIVGGAPGQGKNHFMHSFLNGLIANLSPDEVQFIVADFKYIEYSQYVGLPHLAVPVLTDKRKIVFALHWAVSEMEKRLNMFICAKVRNIADFNSRNTSNHGDILADNGDAEHEVTLPKSIPYIVIVIDDFADAMEQVGKEILSDVQHLAALARAVGIHLVLVTQRPDAKVLPDAIKAKVPGRIVFRTACGDDSEIVLGETGAEHLIGKGDCLFKGRDGRIRRAQTPAISDAEIDAIVAEAKSKYAGCVSCEKTAVVPSENGDVHDSCADYNLSNAVVCK